MPLKGIDELQVKPGDEVCYIPIYPKNQHTEDWEILTVEKVTLKSGQVVTKDGKRFDKEGTEIGGDKSWSGSRANIYTLTDELRARMTRAKRIRFFNNYNWNKLTTAAPSTADALLEEVVATFQKYHIEVG